MEEQKTDSRLEKELDNIYKTQKEVTVIGQIASLVDWDQKVSMPPEGIGDCSEKLALLGGLAHEKFTSKELKESIGYLSLPENFEKLSDKDKIVVKRLSKDVEKTTKLPLEFVEESSRATAQAHNAWEKAKKESNFSIFMPHLEEVVRLNQEQAKLIALPGHPYNSLLDGYEEGMTVDNLDKTFSFLGTELTRLLKTIQSTNVYKNQNEDLLKKRFSLKGQEKINKLVKELMLLSDDRTRMDVSTHPFTTTIGNKDVRITVRYIGNPLDSLGSVIHEGGHALYDLLLPEEFENTVVRNAPSLGMHESQSRFWENMIGKSESFWKHLYPVYKQTFKNQLKDTNLEDWLRLVNIVKPSFIRIEADELTYCMHVILRYEIEKCIIEGSIPVKDVPKVWGDKMQKMLGITPRNDAEGCLQDTHWSGGSIGYFPTYALGSIYAAQLYNQLLKEIPTIPQQIEQGLFHETVCWLEEKVHRHGRTLTAEETIKKACGEGLNPEAYIKYMEEKYSKIYKF